MLSKLQNYKNHIRNGIKNGYSRYIQEARRAYVIVMGGLMVGLILLFLGIFIMFIYLLIWK